MMPSPQLAPVVRLRDLTVRFGSQVALDTVTFDLHPGSSTALVGSNGSGKTTLLSALAGLVEPTAGSIEPMPPHAAYVLQHGATPGWLPVTAGEVLQMSRYGRRKGWSRLNSDDMSAIAEAEERLDVGKLRRRQFGELSGGQRQRVLVAQALAQQAPVLLMDEPITGLDIPSQARILDVIEQETNAGRTVVVSTHSLDEAHHCTQVAVLANRLVAVGPPETVLTPKILRSAYEEHVDGVHADHDHPVGMILLDEHAHDHPS